MHLLIKLIKLIELKSQSWNTTWTCRTTHTYVLYRKVHRYIFNLTLKWLLPSFLQINTLIFGITSQKKVSTEAVAVAGLSLLVYWATKFKMFLFILLNVGSIFAQDYSTFALHCLNIMNWSGTHVKIGINNKTD